MSQNLWSVFQYLYSLFKFCYATDKIIYWHTSLKAETTAPCAYPFKEDWRTPAIFIAAHSLVKILGLKDILGPRQHLRTILNYL